MAGPSLDFRLHPSLLRVGCMWMSGALVVLHPFQSLREGLWSASPGGRP